MRNLKGLGLGPVKPEASWSCQLEGPGVDAAGRDPPKPKLLDPPIEGCKGATAQRISSVWKCVNILHDHPSNSTCILLHYLPVRPLGTSGRWFQPTSKETEPRRTLQRNSGEADPENFNVWVWQVASDLTRMWRSEDLRISHI